VNVRDWAARLIGSIAPGVRSELAQDPAAALRRRFDLIVQATQTPARRGEGGWCDGLSFLHERLVLYVPTPSSRREHFTLLHELGHHLAATCDDLLEWAADSPNPSRVIEEMCDAMAAQLLLPDELLNGVLARAKPSAQHLVALYERSTASREVCAIALAQRLGCEGFVTLIRRDRLEVTFSSRVAETRPYAWRGDLLPPAHPLRTLGTARVLRCESWWPLPGGERRGYWLDALADDRHTYAIFADSDLWGITPLHILDRVEARTERPTIEVHCSTCGFQGVTHRFPCTDCRKPACPRCGDCACSRRIRQSGVCRVCHCRVPKHRLRDGTCNDCCGKRRA